MIEPIPPSKCSNIPRDDVDVFDGADAMQQQLQSNAIG